MQLQQQRNCTTTQMPLSVSRIVMFLQRWMLVLTTLLLMIVCEPDIVDTPYNDSLNQLDRQKEPKMDEATLKINSTLKMDLELWMQSDECYKCPLLLVHIIGRNTNDTIFVDTKYTSEIEIRMVSNSVSELSRTVCHQHYHFGESGVYFLFLFPNGTDQNIQCNLFMTEVPTDSNIPIYIAIAVYFSLALLSVVIIRMRKTNMMGKMVECFRRRPVNTDLGPPDSESQAASSTGTTDSMEKPLVSNVLPQRTRLRCLDTFRGTSIVIMIFVNYGGGGYWFFKHSRWNGLTVADLVFPWFMFIMGVSISLAFHRSIIIKKIPRRAMFIKTIRRTLILFVLGILLNSGGNVDLETLRIPGVLQRFAACYLVVAVIEMLSVKADSNMEVWYSAIRDIVDHLVGWAVVLILVAVWCFLTFHLNVPNCPTGYLGAGGLQENASHSNCTGGAAGYIDRTILGDAHIYQHTTAKVIYHTKLPYDPEGILGTLTSILIVYLGVQAGKTIVKFRGPQPRILRFFIWSLVCGTVATALCDVSKNEGILPVNKNLWSLSFVLAMASMAFILLIVLYFVIDVQFWWSGSPFYQAGMNSILLYVGHEILANYFPWSWGVKRVHSLLLLQNLSSTSLWVLIAMYLHHHKFYLAI